MTKQTPNSPLDVVTALMQERVKFEAWLEALDARRASTPANVYDRVRKDYEARLAGVIRELKEHAAALEVQAEKYTSRLAELAQTEQERRDARAEAELRAHVGELSEGDWTATAHEADEALAAIAAEQAVVGADLNRVHELLGAATAPPVEAAAAVAGATTAPVTAPARDDHDAAPEMVPADQRKTPEQSKFDELAFLKSVVSQRTPVNGRPVGKTLNVPMNATGSPSARAPAPAEGHLPPRGPGIPDGRPAPKPAVVHEGRAPAARVAPPDITHAAADTLGEALTERASRPAPEHEFVRQDQADATAGLVGRAREPERPDNRPYAANITANNPIVLRPSGTVEQPKTLKCVECGAMNYPTEWYCERCGAELASL